MDCKNFAEESWYYIEHKTSYTSGGKSCLLTKDAYFKGVKEVEQNKEDFKVNLYLCRFKKEITKQRILLGTLVVLVPEGLHNDTTKQLSPELHDKVRSKFKL